MSQVPSPAEVTDVSARATSARSVVVGRDAVGNILVTGDGNNVQVTLIIADQRLLPSTPIENPYRGLVPFREGDAAWFFGRTKLIQRMWTLFERLQRGSDPRILAVVGASGLGKSSLVRAGLLPELARRPMEGLDSPKVLVLRPGPLPLNNLANVFGRLDSSASAVEERLGVPSKDGRFVSLHQMAAALSDTTRSRLVFVVDQFEELYTECNDTAARTAFLENLAFAASAPDKAVSLILTLRSDFAGAVRTPSDFATAVGVNRLVVQAMDNDDLSRAISLPADKLGHPWPSALVESLIAQAEGRAGALPLLQFALQRLWPDHVAGQLDKTHWSSRLIEDFLVQAADTLFEKSGRTDTEKATNQSVIRRAFLAMVQLGEGTADIRRVARLSDFVAAGERAQDVVAVLAPFTAREFRLVTASEQEGEPSYELTHEALLSSWDRLRTWLGNVPAKIESERIRSDLRLHRRLSSAAADWKLGLGGLWRPPELDLLLAYDSRAGHEFTDDERAFTDSSKRAWRRLLERDQQMQQRLRKQARIATARELVLASLINQDSDPELSMVLAMYAVAAGWPSTLPEVDQRLHVSVLRSHERLCIKHSERVVAVAWSPDGNRLATASDKQAFVWYYGKGREPLVLSGHSDTVASVAWSPDGKRLATAGRDNLAKLWDADTGKEFLTLRGHGAAVRCVAWSADGTRLATGSEDHTARVWNAITGTELLSLPGHADSFTTVAWSPDNLKLATASHENSAKVWDTQTGEGLLTLHGQHGSITSVGWSPDGRMVVTSGLDGGVKVWDAMNGVDLLTVFGEGSVQSVAWNPKDGLLATAGSGGSAKVWDVREIQPDVRMEPPEINPDVNQGDNGPPLVAGQMCQFLPLSMPREEFLALRGHRDSINSIAWSPDGKHLATASDDKTIRVWDTRQKALRSLSDQGTISSVVFSPDGRQFAVASYRDDNLVHIRSSAIGNVLVVLRGHTALVESIAWCGDGRRLATAGDDTARVWNAESGEELARYKHNRVTSVAWSPNGSRLATGNIDGMVKVWDISSKQKLMNLHADRYSVRSLAWSPNGKQLATGGSATTKIWDAETGNELLSFESNGSPNSVAWSPDGSQLASGGSAKVWSMPVGKEQLTLERDGLAFSMTWSHDGKKLAAGVGGSVKVWNARNGEELLTLPTDSGVRSVDWHPEGKLLLAGNHSGNIHIYAMNIQDLMTLARERITRDLTEEESRRYLHSTKCPPIPDLRDIDRTSIPD